MASQPSTTFASRLLPPGLLLAGGCAAGLSLQGRAALASQLLGLAWLLATVWVLRAAPLSKTVQVLALALVSGAVAMHSPGAPTPATWLLLACLTATFALREGSDGRVLDGWRVVVDAVLVGSSVGALVLALGYPTPGGQTWPWLAAAATAVVAPWVGGCGRGVGATFGTLLALTSTFALVAAVAFPAGPGRGLMSGIGLAAISLLAGRGSLVAPLLIGSPAHQRRCRRARQGTTLVGPLVALAAAAIMALRGETIPPVLVVTLAILGCAAVLRGGIASVRSSASACEDPGVESTERLVALGEYARLVAHEVRNSLSVLFATTDLLRRDRDDSQRQELLDVMSEEGDRVRDVIDQLTAFAGEEDSVQRSPLRLAEIARSAAQRALDRPGWPEGLTIELDLGGGDDVVVGDAQRLEIALSHVLVAAAQGDAGQVRLLTRRDGDERSLVVEGDGRAPEEVAKPTPSKLLSASKGAPGALGLAVAQRTVAEHGGRLQLSLAAGGGLRAVIALPAEAAA